ncbi:hypothetical protein Murru_0910 [Allomuricauda ruestringensis DSM 13258]|uniref:Uncharacterized protein n=1 Tax=Allomuricauda ruestringensis (strain DSM 13258 / CIP 107369 / LMG 19739 / B1) TaxID=886377 RepID=G2PKX8_ALLRU|nr:hypothetical protein [Allomuricauda ruestringensis]AEM69957.1 hypothetical protein Murru_0910 [Allomuricauda ruestringensis DSM 13258]
MKIIWKNVAGKSKLNHEHIVNLEYAMRLQVVRILINEAEHLMDYLSLVVVEINLSSGYVSVHEETPEPLFSKIANNFVQPETQKASSSSSSLVATINV